MSVALRKESVDRNMMTDFCRSSTNVALRKESVDRNSIYAVMPHILERRSPQGERG